VCLGKSRRGIRLCLRVASSLLDVVQTVFALLILHRVVQSFLIQFRGHSSFQIQRRLEPCRKVSPSFRRILAHTSYTPSVDRPPHLRPPATTHHVLHSRPPALTPPASTPLPTLLALPPIPILPPPIQPQHKVELTSSTLRPLPSLESSGRRTLHGRPLRMARTDLRLPTRPALPSKYPSRKYLRCRRHQSLLRDPHRDT